MPSSQMMAVSDRQFSKDAPHFYICRTDALGKHP